MIDSSRKGACGIEIVRNDNWFVETRQLWTQLKKMSVLSFQQKMNVQHWRNKIKNLNGRFARLPNKNRPEAQQVAKQIAFLNKTVEGAIAKAGQLLAQTGNAPARFDQIRRKYNSLPRLDLSSQLTKVKIQKYLDQVKAVKASTQKDLAYVKSVQGKTIAVSPKDIQNMQVYLTKYVPGRLQKGAQLSIKQLEEKISVSQQQIDTIKKTDPNNAHHTRNRLTGKGHYTRAVKRLDEGIALVKTAHTLEAGIGRKGGPDRAAQIKGFESAKVMLNEKFKLAIGHVRMPKAKSNDAKLVQIVKQVLGSGRYKKVYPHVRVVLNTTKRKNAKETAYRSGRTVTFYKYVWEEFQASTAEKVGEDEYYIFHNTLRFYHKADPKTPTGKWILGNRFQGSRILKENIEK